MTDYGRGYSAGYTDQQKVIDRLTEVVRLADEMTDRDTGSRWRSSGARTMNVIDAIAKLKADGVLE